jgi:hypothetical protein
MEEIEQPRARRTTPLIIRRSTPGIGYAKHTSPAAQMRKPLQPMEQFPWSVEPIRPRLQIGPRRRFITGKSIGGPAPQADAAAPSNDETGESTSTD